MTVPADDEKVAEAVKYALALRHADPNLHGPAADLIEALVARIRTDSGTMARQAEMVKDTLRASGEVKKENSFLAAELFPAYFAAEAGLNLLKGCATESQKDDLEAWATSREAARNRMWKIYNQSPIIMRLDTEGSITEVRPATGPLPPL